MKYLRIPSAFYIALGIRPNIHWISKVPNVQFPFVNVISIFDLLENAEIPHQQRAAKIPRNEHLSPFLLVRSQLAERIYLL